MITMTQIIEKFPDFPSPPPETQASQTPPVPTEPSASQNADFITPPENAPATHSEAEVNSATSSTVSSSVGGLRFTAREKGKGKENENEKEKDDEGDEKGKGKGEKTKKTRKTKKYVFPLVWTTPLTIVHCIGRWHPWSG